MIILLLTEGIQFSCSTEAGEGGRYELYSSSPSEVLHVIFHHVTNISPRKTMGFNDTSISNTHNTSNRSRPFPTNLAQETLIPNIRNTFPESRAMKPVVPPKVLCHASIQNAQEATPYARKAEEKRRLETPSPRHLISPICCQRCDALSCSIPNC